MNCPNCEVLSKTEKDNWYYCVNLECGVVRFLIINGKMEEMEFIDIDDRVILE